MLRPWRFVTGVVSLAVLVPTAATAGTLTRSEAALLGQVNRTRAAYGVAPLRVDTRLTQAARAHSREMAATGRFEHGSLADRIARFGVPGIRFGENLAWAAGTSASAKSIVDGWLASPGHRANLLSPAYRRIGLGELTTRFLGVARANVVTADFAGS